jgi:hypothetical protein
VTADDELKPGRTGAGGVFASDAVVLSSLADARFILSSPNACFARGGLAEAPVGDNPLEAFVARGRALADLWMWESPPETHRRLFDPARAGAGGTSRSARAGICAPAFIWRGRRCGWASKPCWTPCRNGRTTWSGATAPASSVAPA